MPTSLISKPLTSEIGRVSFGVRLLGIIAGHSAIFVLIYVAAIYASTELHSPTSSILLILAGMAMTVSFVYVFVRFAILPRLRDIGLYGPTMWGALVLCLFPPTSLFFQIALLVTPHRFVRGGTNAL
jgi:hypothetical protein